MHIRSHSIDHLNLTVHEFEHGKTGAMHFHFGMPHTENVFMVALRTVPMDSTGVAHILEHTALCGSEKFPVRDPFFLMIRRSLNTFMNAFTTSDYTAYPFASQNAQDFQNLLEIYLDAVFFARLDSLDFAQEGHRIEFENPEDDSSDLVYRGVVYNEMKGDSSSVISVLYDKLKQHLYPSATYHFNSGGDPTVIPDLTYDQLLDFYKSHYHPSNAIFMTFGDMQAIDLQNAFESNVLSRFSRSDIKIEVTPEVRFEKTKRVEDVYAVDDPDDIENKSHIVLAWLLGENTDLELLLKCNLLSDVLLDTSASPLRQALENTDLGGAPSPLCGLEETNREMSFFCGVEGSESIHADAIEKLILTTLERVANEGIAKEKLEACLHQLELSHREIGGDGYPFGLQLIFSCMSAAVHRGDPIDLLDLDPVLQKLRDEIEKPEFIKELVQDVLLNNKHRVRLCLVPDADLNEKNRKAEKDRLSERKSQLTTGDMQEIVALSSDLKARQNREEPVEVLPKVGLADIPLSFNVPEGEESKLSGGTPLTRFEAGTNGLVYHQIVADMPQLELNELHALPLFTSIVSEIGSAGRGYLDTQHIQHSISGGINAFSTIRGAISEPDLMAARVTFSSRCLNRNTESMMDILKETFTAPNFDEPARIRHLIKQARIRREASITASGHVLAMSAAASHFRPISIVNHHLSGLEGIRYLKELDDKLDDDSNLEGFIATLKRLHTALSNMPNHLLLVSESGFADESLDMMSGKWQDPAVIKGSDDFSVPFDASPRNQAWLTTTQVNFCASAFKTVAEDHPDSAALTVLGGVLRNGFLHRAIREQGGAYGGGASHDAGAGLFRFYSFRDPNLQATFDAFESSVDWILTSDIEFEMIEESILGIISSIDAPSSPAGEARQAFHNNLFGRTGDHRRKMRERILNVSVDDVKKVAGIYLQNDSARAVVTNESQTANLEESFTIHQI